MPKTYNTLTSDVTAGSVLTATLFNQVQTNVRNYRVPPMVVAKLTVGQSIPNNTDTTLTFASKDIETDTGLYGTNKFTIQTAGVYIVSAVVMWEANATGVRYMVLRKNSTGTAGSLDALVNTGAVPTSTARTTTTFSVPLSLAANDDIDLRVLQSSGGALGVNNYGGYFSAVWVGQVS